MFASALASLFHARRPAPVRDARQPLRLPSLDAIRNAMLGELADLAASAGTKVLACRIAAAPDAAHLWALRGELLCAVAAGRGEAAARAVLDGIDELFLEVLPPGLASSLAAARARARRGLACDA